jgi:poly-gamma-glutamate synthesis protein (capsule biosynthesis protein)
MRVSLIQPVRKSVVIIAAVTLLILTELILSRLIDQSSADLVTEETPSDAPIPTVSIAENFEMSATLLAFGDVNLGRKVGQRILKGEINFPFEKIDLKGMNADIVFANLESPLSEQNGETESPRSNIVFTGPPHGAMSLRNAGITVVSTANNHSLDYGKRGLHETIEHLSAENILMSGTSKNADSLFNPLLMRKNNINFAIFAVTSFVNFNPSHWRSLIASVDTVALAGQIAEIRDQVDVVMMSCHGGTEYGGAPSQEMSQFAVWCVRNGVDIFLGHHPHVTYGIEKIGSSYIVHSLGNFVFYQPQHVWTQRSYGVLFRVEKMDSSVAIEIERILPLKVGFQTEVLTDSASIRALRDRTQKFSNIDISSYWK